MGWVLAAPVAIDGRHHIMTMVVKRTDNRTGLYVHEVRITKEVVREAAIITAVPAEAGQSRGSSRTVANRLREALAIDEGSNKLSSEAAAGAIQGLTTPDGTIHLVADALTSRTALPVLLHEMFHSGVRSLVGDVAWSRTLARLGALYRAAAGREATGERTNSPFWTQALRRVALAKPLPGQEVEEFAAYAIEHQALAPPGVRALVERLIGALKAWLLRRFGRQLGHVTPAQLEALAIAALRAGSSAPRATQAASVNAGSVPESAADAMLALAESDELFAIERSDATTIEGAIADVVPGAGTSPLSKTRATWWTARSRKCGGPQARPHGRVRDGQRQAVLRP